MIKASAIPLGLAFLSGHYEPAPVQREFQWTSREASALLEDIFAAFAALGLDPQEAHETGRETGSPSQTDKVPDGDDGVEAGTDDAGNSQETMPLEFDATPLKKAKIHGRGRKKPPQIYNLNTVVLYTRPQKEISYYVFDGMQRLTTLTLLLVVLRDTAGPDSHTSFFIDKMLYFNQDKKERRLEYPTKAGTLARLVNGSSKNRHTRSSGDVRMQEVHKTLKEQVEGWSDARRDAFLTFLIQKTYLTLQTMNDMSLAYQTFITANDRGRKLDISDILKGYFVEQANARNATNDQIRNIESSWRKIGYQLHNANMHQFITAVENLKFGFAPGTAAGERMLELFGDDQSADELEAWVTGELTRMADIFVLQKAYLFKSASVGVDLRFRQLSFLGWDEWQTIALALGLGHQGEFDKKGWRHKINLLYRACYGMELLGWSAERKRRMQQALDELGQGRNPFRQNEENSDYGPLAIFDYLKGKARENLTRPFVQPERRGAIIRWLETVYWNEPVPKSCTNHSSVEHILPLSPSADWARTYTPQQRDKLCNLLGNLCILDRKANYEIGNSSWDEKRKTYRRLQQQHHLVGQIAGRSAWLEIDIINRTQKLATRAAQELLLIPDPAAHTQPLSKSGKQGQGYQRQNRKPQQNQKS